MEDPSEEIDIGIFDRLFAEEIVGHGLHTIGKFVGRSGLSPFHNFGKVLDDASELRETRRKTHADEAMGATDLGQGRSSAQRD